MGVLFLQLVVVELGIGRTELLVHLGIVQRVHHHGIAAQGGQGLAWLFRLEGFGQRLVVIAHGAGVADLLLQVDGAPDDGHGLAASLHVEQVEGNVLQTDGQQVAVDDGHALDGGDGFTRHGQCALEVARTIVGIGELGEVVDNAFLVANLAGCLNGAQSVFDCLLGFLGNVVDLAGNAQIVVGVDVGTCLGIGVDGLQHEPLGLVGVAQADVDDGQIVVGACQGKQLAVALAEALGLEFGIGGLSIATRLEETVAAVAEQGGMNGILRRAGGGLHNGERQGAVDVGQGFLEVGIVIVESLGGKPDVQAEGVARLLGGEHGLACEQLVALVADVDELAGNIQSLLLAGLVENRQQRVDGIHGVGFRRLLCHDGHHGNQKDEGQGRTDDSCFSHSTEQCGGETRQFSIGPQRWRCSVCHRADTGWPDARCRSVHG